MAILLVTYDLNKPGQNYPDLLPAIKAYPFAMLSESSYAIETTKSPESVFKALSALLDANDTLFVLTLSSPYAGRGPELVVDWLGDRL